MRIWAVPTALMCTQHLLGEHKEIHMIVGAIKKGKNLDGYYDRGLIDTSLLASRHEEIVQEFKRRLFDSGLQHLTPIGDLSFITRHRGYVEVAENVRELERRCPECRRLIEVGS